MILSPQVFDAYAQRKGVDAHALRFLIDGERINPNQSPAEVSDDESWNKMNAPLPLFLSFSLVQLELEDQDQIDCMLEQQGGFLVY